MKEYTGIKYYARKAKNRLSNGYWQTIEKDKADYIKKHFNQGDNLEQLNYMFQRMIQDDVFEKSEQDPNELNFYKKVKKLLTENEYVLNPIMQLIDHAVYDSLSEIAKQNYIYELTEKYNQAKQKIEEEQKREKVLNI